MHRIIPVVLFKTFGVDLLAIFDAIKANNKVDKMQVTRQTILLMPPRTKWLTEPVSAVKVIINTLVPTAVFNSYPKTEVRINSIIIPPPAPINPQIKPIIIPDIID